MTTTQCSCIKCKKLTSNLGLSSHIRIVHDGDISLIESGRKAKLGKSSWNKGLTKETNISIKNGSEKLRVKLTGKTRNITFSDEGLKKLSELSYLKNNFHGYHEKSGRGKSGRYKNIWCDSSWELAFVIWCQDNNKNIKRNTEKFQYIWENKKKNYIPDFIVDGELIEIKGWSTNQWKAKELQVKNITVFYKDKMKPILDYVVKNYGKNFIKLYD